MNSRDSHDTKIGPQNHTKANLSIALPQESGSMGYNWGPFSEFLANKNTPLSPPVVILSIPRSGSTWVGEVLGLSASSLYLREPITQTFIKTRDSGPSFFELDEDNLPKTYESSATNALAGFPLFPAQITQKPNQWALTKRKHKRVVIKEINPFMLDWLIKNFHPRIVYLIRHPVAVTDSFNRLGWNGIQQIEPRLRKESLAKYKDQSPHTDSFWAQHGALQAIILNEVTEKMKDYKDFRLVQYEHLCAEPVAVFKELYAFTELEWNDTVEQNIIKRSQPQTINTHNFSTQRNSAHETEKWRHEVDEDNIQQLKDAYLSFGPPFYNNNW